MKLEVQGTEKLKPKVKALTQEEIETYSRQIVLKDIGYEGQLKLRNAKVCIIGQGGLGNLASMQMASMGVGYLRIVDRDVVERSNLHRQPLYTVEDLNYPKVEAAAKRLSRLNPDTEIEALPLSVNDDTAEKLVEGVDVVVDGLDSIEARYAVNRACVKLGVPYVFGAVSEVFGNLSTIIPRETPCLQCFYPDFKDYMLPACAVVGVHPSIIAVITSLQVSEAVRIIKGDSPLLAGALLYCDLRNLSFDKVKLAPQPNCPTCGVKASQIRPREQREPVEELCGRSGKRTFVVTPRKELDLDWKAVDRALRKLKAKVKVKAKLGVTYTLSKVSVNLLKSGIMILNGINTKEEALSIYQKLLVDQLNINHRELW
ncbi:HesA/MoeB/ThiF family protein [Candidatus Hecatella orcuttiae]|uniref:HesA/MoeB/ThiF family protein n=1 Tax=Candidatus Hecatella orcuttiae TaxID=1935119 RepID=UPI002867DF98|nr:HesA/MoeB/ThiF family protein [Candidatus Hecatella orcuttiae]